ncbi:hypothetical protein MD484_g6836, partial [Candolleomyces efflorescens]
MPTRLPGRLLAARLPARLLWPELAANPPVCVHPAWDLLALLGLPAALLVLRCPDLCQSAANSSAVLVLTLSNLNNKVHGHPTTGPLPACSNHLLIWYW